MSILNDDRSLSDDEKEYLEWQQEVDLEYRRQDALDEREYYPIDDEEQ